MLTMAVHLARGGATRRQLLLAVLVASLALCSILPVSNAFLPSSTTTSARRSLPTFHYSVVFHHQTASTITKLPMAANDDGPGLLPTLGVIGIIIIFVATSFLPPMDISGGAPANIADSVVTKQDAPDKFKNFENTKFDKLSRATIQEKLNAIPVFYLVDNSDGSMQTNIFLSYQDARDSSSAADDKSATVIKATTLDQVMYPLVLKRGRMRMAPAPAEVKHAEDAIMEGDSKMYKIIPSKSALNDASALNLNVAQGDVPLFVADRLAFAGSKGAQLPLFLEKADCMASYNRLRETGGMNRLPETPTIRTSTLLDVLYSMEKGTRPGVSQLAFYSSADDLLQATEMMTR